MSIGLLNEVPSSGYRLEGKESQETWEDVIDIGKIMPGTSMQVPVIQFQPAEGTRSNT